MLSRLALPVVRRTAAAVAVPAKVGAGGQKFAKVANVLVMYGIFAYFRDVIIATKM